MTKLRVALSLALLALLLVFSCKTDQHTHWKHNDNTVRVRLSAGIQALNPYLARSAWVRVVTELIFQYPMDFDPETLEMAPQLLKAPPIVTDIADGEFAGGQSFAFEILDEAVWDDGQPVTGHDYEFSVKILFNPKLPLQAYANYFEFVKDIKVDAANPKKFTVVADRKYILNYGVVSNVTMLPQHLYDPEGWLKDFTFQDLSDPAKAATFADDERLQKFAEAFLSPKYGREIVSGSGPYKVSEWVDDQRIVLTKKEKWWGDKLAGKYTMLTARPDTIIFLPIPDQTAAITTLKSEDFDVGFELETTQFLELRQDSFLQNTYNFYTPPRFAFFYTAMQNRNPKLADKKVRQALARLIDMDAIIQDHYNGMGERIIGPFLPDKPYYHKGLKPIPLDLDKARQLLAEAGWQDSNGNGILDKTIDGQLTEMKLEYLYTPGIVFQETFTEIFKNNAKKVGIEVERVPVESNVMGQRMRNGEYELAGRGASALPIPDDPKQLFHTDSAQPGGSNYSRFGNAETDALIEEIRQTTDEAKRNDLYRKFQEIIYDEHAMIFQFAPLDRVVVHKRFEAIVTRRSPGVSLPHLKQRK